MAFSSKVVEVTPSVVLPTVIFRCVQCNEMLKAVCASSAHMSMMDFCANCMTRYVIQWFPLSIKMYPPEEADAQKTDAEA